MTVHYVSSDPFPGIVECEFMDANDRAWVFVEKTAVVSSESFGRESEYPLPGVIACEIIGHSRTANGKKLVQIDTEVPFGVESIDGEHRFEIPEESLVQYD